MSPSVHKGAKKPDPGAEVFAEGVRLLRQNPAFDAVPADFCRRDDCGLAPPGGWAVVDSDGTVHVNPRRRAEPEEWAWCWRTACCTWASATSRPPGVSGSSPTPTRRRPAARW